LKRKSQPFSKKSAYSCTVQSGEPCFHAPLHFTTTPWMACVPKCVFAGAPNVSVMFENSTLVPPRMQIVSGEGFPNGAGTPFAVT
jgi:hypothetical protein